MVMFMVDLISWWYFRGWGVFLSGFKNKLGDTVDLFSFSEMLRTLFKPYRQISAGADGPAVNVAIDKLISRLVGFFARVTLLITGTVVLVMECLLGIVIAILWPVLPALPVLGIVLAVMGVTF